MSETPNHNKTAYRDSAIRMVKSGILSLSTLENMYKATLYNCQEYPDSIGLAAERDGLAEAIALLGRHKACL
jgi:hypothetical protein